MYNTSDKYKTAIQQSNKVNKITGNIKLNTGDIISITDNDIVENSLSIDNACVNSNDFEIGCAYLGELKISLYTSINRYSLYDGVVTLSYWLLVDTNEWEEIPLGIYTIQEATRTNNQISITAYDNMSKFDTNIYNISYGTPFEIIRHICTVCKVDIGNTQSEIDGLSPKYTGTNNPVFLSINTEQDNTGRDLIGDVAMAMGAFATIGRDGKLYFRRFGGDTYPAIVDNIYSITVSDYITKYSGINATIKTDTYEVGDTSYLTYELTNDLLNTGTDETKDDILDFLLNIISNNNYIPVDMTYVNDPSIDLGDYYSFTYNDEEVYSYVMTLNWKYKGIQLITSVGSNPYFSTVKTESEKSSSNIEKQVNAGFFGIYTYVNIHDFDINTTEYTKIADFYVSITNSIDVLLIGQATVDNKSSNDIYIQTKYIINNIEYNTWYPISYCHNGKNLLNFYAPIFFKNENSDNRIQIYIKLSNISDEIEDIPHISINAEDELISVFGSITGVNTGVSSSIIIDESTSGFILDKNEKIVINNITDNINKEVI